MKIDSVSKSSFGIVMPIMYIEKAPEFVPVIVQQVQKAPAFKPYKHLNRDVFQLKVDYPSNSYPRKPYSLPEAILSDFRVYTKKRKKGSEPILTVVQKGPGRRNYDRSSIFRR